MSAPVEKQCRRCGETKPVAAFYHNRSREDGRDFYCADCRRSYVPARSRKDAPEQEAPQPPVEQALPARLPASVFVGKPPQTERQAMRWVLDHLAIEDVNPVDCPSSKAWFFFIQARTDADFASRLALKFVPPNAELTKRRKFEDDDRNLKDRLDAIERQAEQSRLRQTAALAAAHGLPTA